jgi:hypothetical protein
MGTVEEWILTLTHTQELLSNLPICPYAKQAYLNKRYSVMDTEYDTISLDIEVSDLTQYQVVIFKLKEYQSYDIETLKQKTNDLNNQFNKNDIIVLDNDPRDPFVINGVTTTYSSANNSLFISVASIANGYIKIFTDEEIPVINNYISRSSKQWIGATYSGDEPGTINDNIQNFDPSPPASLYGCYFLNLQSINNVYITSPNLGSFDTVSAFSHNIVKKVHVTANYGYMIFDNSMTTNDFLDCSNQTLKTIEFHIRDGRGRYIYLHNAHITFSIIFNKFNVAG